jgi:hypothetical protein
LQPYEKIKIINLNRLYKKLTIMKLRKQIFYSQSILIRPRCFESI